METTTKVALDKFINLIQDMKDVYMTKNFPALQRPVITADDGRRYAKIIVSDSSSRSVYCFVDLTNGDVLKAATWKAPAKHSRGNIFANDPTAGVNVYGANYIK